MAAASTGSRLGGRWPTHRASSSAYSAYVPQRVPRTGHRPHTVVAGREPGGTVTNLVDPASEFVADDVGGIESRPARIGAVTGIDGVDPGGRDPDDDAAFARVRLR
jgi:hypothetical protein